MKRVIFIFIAIFSFMFSPVQASVQTNDDQVLDCDKVLDWAICIYMCGSDLESVYGAATNDLYEIENVNLPEGIEYYIQTGGTRDWQNDFLIDSANTLLRYSNQGREIIKSEDFKDMGNRDNLIEFLNFTKEIEAKHKIFIFWNHGLGTVGGVIYDELFGSILSIDDLKYAFDNTYGDDNENPPFDIIGFDACLMSSIDVANVMQDAGKYMIASQETEPISGWSYEDLSKILVDNPNISLTELNKAICDKYYAKCIENNENSMITLAVWDLSKMPQLMTAYDNLGYEARTMADNDKNYGMSIARSAHMATNFGGNNPVRGYTDMMDLGDFVSKNKELFPKTASKLLRAIDNVIVYKVNGQYRLTAKGVSVYYPLSTDRDRFDRYSLLENITPIYPYLYNRILNHKGILEHYRFESLSNIALDVDNKGRMSVTIPQEVLPLVKGVSVGLINYTPGDNYMTLMGLDYYADVNWNTGKVRIVTNGKWGSLNRHPMYVMLEEINDNNILYTVPILLNGEEKSMIVSYDRKTEENTILGYMNKIDVLEKEINKLLQMKDGDEITIVMYDYIPGVSLSDLQPSYKETIIFDSNETKVEDFPLPDGIYGYFLEFDSIVDDWVISDTALFCKEGDKMFMCDGNGEPVNTKYEEIDH